MRAIKKRSKVRIDIGPDRAQVNYHFKAQRRRHGKWRTIRRSQTLGPRDRITLNFRRGRYRIVVPAQHGLTGARATVRLAR